MSTAGNLGTLTDREKAAVTALIEEYKARWQQLLTLEGEVNKWTASYVIALVVGTGWVLGSDKVKGLGELFSARGYDNCYFILSLAAVNAVYMLSIAFKGYQIQQISYYLHTVVGKDIIRVTGIPYNSWEVWRRAQFCSPKRIGKSEWRRGVYYPIITLLPFAVSFSVLWMYIEYAGNNLTRLDPHNIYFYCVITIHVVALGIALSTTSFNKKWEKVTREEHITSLSHESKRPQDPSEIDPTHERSSLPEDRKMKVEQAVSNPTLVKSEAQKNNSTVVKESK